jgi:O-antigen ligase
MKYAAVLLAFALIARNNLYFNAPFEVLRGLSLVVVALIGGIGIFQTGALRSGGRYWPLIGYLFATVLSLTATEYLGYVGFQTLSVAIVIIFAIACGESKDAGTISSAVLNATFSLYWLLAALSLLLYFVKPALVYEMLYGGELRFRGIFPKSSMMGASAGILVGLCLFLRKKKLWARMGAIVFAIACILLTQSRTFWVATLAAGTVTYAVYYRHGFKMVAAGGMAAIILSSGIYAADIKIRGSSFGKFARVESITNLTGRVQLWREVIDKFYENPVIGLGLTAGASAFIDQKNVLGFGNDQDALSQDRSIGKTTMHSGYMQSLLDVGAIGTFFYLSLVIVPLLRLYRNDVLREYPIQFYLLLFISIANISENIIYAVTVFNSVLFFMLAAFAMNIQRPMSASKIGTNTNRSMPFQANYDTVPGKSV